jgi:sortase A
VKPTTKRQVFRPPPARSFLRWTPHLFFIVGILAVGYVAVALLDARFYQARASRGFEQAVKARRSAMLSSSEGSNSPPARPSQPAAAATEGREIFLGRAPWGRIEIASIGVSSMILEGVDQATLRRGIGHIPGTASPGQAGNVVLAGHRDTFFRTLHNIHKDDEITLQTLDGSYRYRVDFTQVVAPEYTKALDSSDGAILTLVTCYPFSFMGPAPQRYIVRAHRIPE